MVPHYLEADNVDRASRTKGDASKENSARESEGGCGVNERDADSVGRWDSEDLSPTCQGIRI